MQIDVWQNDWRKIKLSGPNPDCKTCGQKIFEFLDADAQEFSAVLCGRNAVQIAPPKAAVLDLAAFAANLSHTGEVKSKTNISCASLPAKTK